MNTDRNLECEWLEANIDAWVCGDCSAEEHVRIEAHIEVCADCSDIAAEARELGNVLAVLPTESCPDEVLERAFTEIESVSTLGKGSWFAPKYLSAAAMILLIVGGAILFNLKGSQTSQYSQEEVAQARRELGQAIGVIVRVGAYGVASALEETLKTVEQVDTPDEDIPAAQAVHRARMSIRTQLRNIGQSSRDSLDSVRKQFMEVEALAKFSGRMRALRDATTHQNNHLKGE